jgi:hypothetical protein
VSYTTQHLLDSIGRKSFVPTGQSTFTDADLLAVADEQLLNVVVPAIISAREEYLVYSTDVSVVAGTNAYNIPSRAVGQMIRDVALVDGTNVDFNFPRLDPDMIETTNQGTPAGFYLKNNQVVLYPTPDTSGKTLRLFYYLRPSALVETSAAAVISSINTATNTISVASIPSTWVTGDEFDLIKQDGAQEPLAIDQTSTTVSGTDLTFASLPTGLRVGDYVALAGETPLVQLPAEFRPILAQAVAAEILDDQNQPGAEKAQKKLQEMLAAAIKLVTPRVTGQPKVITSNNWF